MNAWLESGAGIRHYLKDSCSIGRLAENEIVIDDTKVSRRHALVHLQGGAGYWLLDFGSSNGTQLNGRNLLKPTLLSNQDRITIGNSRFIFRQVQTAGPAGDALSAPRTVRVADAFAAIEHHTVLLDEACLAQGKNPGARERLQHFFSEPFEWPSLPRSLLQWIEGQSQVHKAAGSGATSSEPFVLKREERRLVIRFEPIFRNQSLLLLTEERSALSPEMLQRLGLSERESQTLHHMAQGKSNADIAKVLKLNTRTVEKHIEHILNKLNVTSRMAALLRVIELSEKL